MADSNNTLDLKTLRSGSHHATDADATDATLPLSHVQAGHHSQSAAAHHPATSEPSAAAPAAHAAAPELTPAEPIISPLVTPTKPTEAEPGNHPEAAAAAREKIAALHSTLPLTHPDALPAAPTSSLVTDKQALARHAELAPGVTRRKLPSAVAPLLTAAGIFALVLLLFKAPIIFSQLSYTLGNHDQTSTGTGVTASSTSVVPAENTISIPKINVHAPVQYISSYQEADIQKALEDGVVHYSTTAVPGQPGNVAIFGHSSNDWWEPGNYKFVFVLLDKLSPGDQITVDYQSVRYTYEVTGSKIVDPTAVDVLNPTPTPTLTLITCSPPGTSLKRLVVSAKQVSPSPTTSQVTTNTSGQASQGTLPSSAPGFFEQIGKFWSGVWQGFAGLFGGNTSTSTNPSASPNATGALPASK